MRAKGSKILVSLALLLYAGIFIYSGNKGAFDYTWLRIKIAGSNQREVEAGILPIYESLKSEPNNSNLYGELGDLYCRLGEYNEAINQYKIVISILPKRTKAMSRLVFVYSAQHELSKALDVLQNIRQIEPDNPGIYYNIACIYAKQNKTDKSVEWLKQAIEKGFHNWDLIKSDPDLANIRNTPYLTELIKNH
jgi:tetratricopeptide (TPR) repeat protein